MLVAAILRDPKLTIEEWLQYAARSPILSERPPREIVNAFTGNREIDEPDPSEVDIVIDGVTIGALQPSSEFEDSGELHVFATKTSMTRVEEIARKIALDLDAKFEWLVD